MHAQCTSEAHLRLARIYYEWNDLNAAQQHAQHCLQLTRQIESVDTFASYAVFLVRLRLAQGDVPGAVAILAEAQEFVRQHNFVDRIPDIAAARVLTLVRQGNLSEAAHLAQMHELPISQARVSLAGGTAPLRWRNWNPGGGRWRQRVGGMNSPRSDSPGGGARRTWRSGRGCASAR